MTQSTSTFDFSRVGKQTPYRVPEGYMEQQEQSLLASIQSQPTTHKTLSASLWIWYAAACAVLLAIYPAIRLVHRATDIAPVYSQTPTTTADDWSDFADADIFLDNMNW